MAKQKISDSELVSICEAEMQAALGTQGKYISIQRSKAIDYYLGELDEYLPVEEDRSKAVSRDVSDTVEWILPSLMRIFIDAENAVEFTPVGPDDEQAAEIESDVVQNIFYEQNEGFLNLYTFCKDALLQKTGIFKCWWEEPEFKREEYRGLTQEQYLMLLQEPGCQYEVLEEEEVFDPEVAPIPLYNVTMKVARRAGKVMVSCVPPDEFGISSQASSPNPKKAPFMFHRRKMTAAELVADGVDEDFVKSLPTSDDVESDEDLAKSEISGDWDESAEPHWSMRMIWVTECYLDIDRDGDGVQEKLQVKLASSRTGYGNSKLIEVNEVDSAYISAATPVIMTHKFYGQSVADLVMDIEEIKTSLLRGMLDNTYLANNGRTAVNERVNLDDLLESRPGGIVRTKGMDPPGNHIMQMHHTPVPQQTFGLLEVMDQLLKHRAGVGDEVQGLDANALANVNTGVIVQAYDAARMRIEMIARILAETGLKECFRDVHELARKYQDIPMMLKLKNDWVQVNPAAWRERVDMTVRVGIGNYTRERQLMALTDIGQIQQALAANGAVGRLIDEERIYNMAADRAKAYGMEPSRYFLDPRKQPPPQPRPDPAEIMAQIEGKKLEMEAQKLQIETYKAQMDGQIRLAQEQGKREQAMLRAEIDQMKAQMDFRKMAVDEQSQVMNAQSTAAATAAKAQYDELSLLLDKYKAELSSSTDIEIKLMEMEQRQSEQLSKLYMQLEEFRRSLMEDDDEDERQETAEDSIDDE